MSRRRHFSRHRIALRVRLRVGDGWLDCSTIDVSRAGVFLRTPTHIHEGRIIQAEITLPGGEVLNLLGKVCRSVGAMVSANTIPGVGVEFLSPGPEIRTLWDDFILEHSKRSKDLAAISQRKSEGREHHEGTTAPLLPRKDLAIAHLKIRPPDAAKLKELVRRRVNHASLILRTDVKMEEGQRVEVAVVHFQSDAELQVRGLVASFRPDPGGGRDTVVIRWQALEAEEHQRLKDFIRTGRRGSARLGIESRQELERLRRLANLDGDRPERWIALGWALLDAAEDVELAANAFLRALVADGEHLEAIRALALCRALQKRPAEAFGLVRAGRKQSPRPL